MIVEELLNKRVALLGFGVNHQALATYLLRRGVQLTIRDRNPSVREDGERLLAAFDDAVTWDIQDDILKDLHRFDIVFRSPSIPVLNPALQQFSKKGGTVYSQTRLFFDLCPAKIIGVTGSNGKGTTVSLITNMLKAGYTDGQTYQGGNIGLDPFSFLEDLTENDIVVLELSSFQLQDVEKGPDIAVLLSLTPDHLDHHKSLAEYYQAKGNIVHKQSKQGVAIVHADNPEAVRQAQRAGGTVQWFSRHTPRRQSAWVNTDAGEEALFLQLGDAVDSRSLKDRCLLGAHNIENIVAASLAAAQCGVSLDVIAEQAVAFAGLPHRLQLVTEHEGVRYVDDSIATSPAASLAALTSFTGSRIHLIAGGSDKGHDFKDLARTVVEQCATVSLLPGKGTKRFAKEVAQALKTSKGCIVLDMAQSPLFPTILSGIVPHLAAGDVVLLSPGAASFGSFTSYKDRGDQFAAAVLARTTS